MILDQVMIETNNLITDVYVKVRSGSATKESFREIEEYLSSKIYESERLVHESRRKKLLNLENEYYRRRTLLKRIADGLAWQILDYDTHLNLGLSLGHSSGFMYDKESYVSERNLVRGAYQLPNVHYAIQCDITNYLRVFDVIIVKNDGQIRFVEVKGKSSKNDRRATRQRKRYEKVLNFLQNGYLQPVDLNGTSLRTIRTSLMYDHYWKELDELCKIAIKGESAWAFLDDCLFLCVVDNYTCKSADRYLEPLKHLQLTDPFFMISSLGRHLQRNLASIPITCLPLTIFPIGLDNGIKFLAGELDAIIALDINSLIRKLCSLGITASFQGAIGTMQIELQDTNIVIDEGSWSKLLNELITIPSFIAHIAEGKRLISQELFPKPSP